MEQIAAFVVLPNKIVIPLTDAVPVELLKIPEPEVNFSFIIFHV